MPLLTTRAAKHFDTSLSASTLHAFIDEPAHLNEGPAWHEERDSRAKHAHGMAGHKPEVENEIMVEKSATSGKSV